MRLRTKPSPSVPSEPRPASGVPWFINFDQPGMVVVRQSLGAESVLERDFLEAAGDVTGAYVKIAPTVRSSERWLVNSKAIRERILSAGAVAVVFAPVVVPDSISGQHRADQPPPMAKSPEAHLREWFDGVKGQSLSIVVEAMAEALASAGDAGL